jgi:hypothetical protein
VAGTGGLLAKADLEEKYAITLDKQERTSL